LSFELYKNKAVKPCAGHKKAQKKTATRYDVALGVSTEWRLCDCSYKAAKIFSCDGV